MPDEVTFIDLACLLRLGPDTTLEKFGSAINASIFDASNLAGTLKQKSLIDFSSYYPGPNTIIITDTGKALITEADAKSTTPFDNLDQEVLFQISGGKRIPIELQNTLNVRPKDLALRLYKLFKQGFIIYDLKSGGADIQLTESGYLKAKSSKPAAPQTTSPTPGTPATQQASIPLILKGPAPAQAPPQQGASTNPTAPPAPATKPAGTGKPNNILIYIIILLVLLIIIGAVYKFVILKK